jgi:hypothetical protein
LVKRKFRDRLRPLRYPVWIAYDLIRFPESARFAPAWMRSLVSGRDALQDKVPWVPFVARDWFSAHLKPSMRVFEYGAGGSTLFIARRVKELITVEHNAAWYARVRDALAQEGLTNCELLLQEPTPQLPDNPLHVSVKPEYAQMGFDMYVRTIDRYPDESFDLVLVDANARTACLLHAIPKVRVGGFLALDNSDEYREAKAIFSRYPRTDLRGFGPYWPPASWQTSVWKKTGPWQVG